MSWADDTDNILSDGLQDTVVVVKDPTPSYLSSSVFPNNTNTVIETSTVNIFSKTGAFKKEVKGHVKISTHVIFFPSTSSVAVDHRVFESGETYYHEVLNVKDYEGHKEADTMKVEGR